MRPLHACASAALLCLAASLPAAFAPISVSSGTANGHSCQVITWTDSAGLPRSAWIASDNHKITRLTYILGGGPITDDEVSGYGLGNLTNHGSCGATVTRLGVGVSGYSASAAFAGPNHYIWRSTFRFDMCGSGAQWRIDNDYLFVNGRDDFLQTVAYDSSDVPASTSMGEDMRGPYDQMTWGGNPNIPISGLGWGDHYKFRTLGAFVPSTPGCPYDCAGTVPWDWTQPNTIPYTWAWKDLAQGADIDREYAVIQNQRDSEQDFGGTYWGSGNVPASLPASSGPSNTAFACWAMPTQMDCYDSPWTSGRMTWGATYGTFNNSHPNDRGTPMTVLSTRPVNAWSWLHYVGRFSAGKVPALVADTENIYKTSLSAVAPAAPATTGPRAPGNFVGPSVGSMPSISYPKPGYDFLYRAWTLESAGQNTSFTLAIPGGASLDHPLCVLRSAPGLPCRVSLDGVDLVADQDYSASYDAGAQKLWLSLDSSLAAGSRVVQVLFTCGSPTPTRTPCAACTATPTVTVTPSYSVTPTPSPSPTCQPLLFDNLEDNNTQNALGGWWSTWAGSSTILPSPWVPSSGGHSSSWAARANGSNNLAGQPSLSSSLPSATDFSAYLGFSFWFKGDGNAYRFQIHSAVEGGNYNDYKFDFTPPAGWSLVTVPFSSLSFPGWGPAYAMDNTQVLGLSWVPMTAGAYDFSVDDITLACPAAPSPTPTATQPLGSPTPTRTGSPTATRTASPSASPTATPARTPSGTASASPTPSPSRSATPSSSPSPSPTDSATATASPTETPYAGSPTDTASPTGTWSVTESPTISDTPSATPTVSSSATASPSFSASPTASPTATASVTASATPSASPTGTASPTPTLSATPSASPSASASPSVSATGTATDTPTLSATRSPSPSASPVLSQTATPTPSVSRTASATPSPTGVASPSPAPSPTAEAYGPLLRAVVPLPQPNPRELRLRVEGQAERVELELYTKALVLSARESLPGGSGWFRVALPDAWRALPSDLYFVRATARSGKRSSSAGCRLLLVR